MPLDLVADGGADEVGAVGAEALLHQKVDMAEIDVAEVDRDLLGVATLPPIIFPGRPERWWGDEALKAETDAPQATLEQRHQAAGDVLALRCRGFFFGGGSVFKGIPHSGGDRPIKRQRKKQDKPVEPIGALDLAGLEIEPPGLEVREHRLDAPAQAVVARAPWRWTIGHGDDPWLRMAFRMQHGNMRAGAFPSQLDACEKGRLGAQAGVGVARHAS